MIEATKIFALVFPAIVIPFGTLGNLCALLTLCLGKVKRRPVNVLLIGLALSDIVCLDSGYLKSWMNDINSWYQNNNNYTERELNPSDMVPVYLFSTFSTLSATLVCLLTIERFLAVYYVFKPIQIVNMKSATLLVSFLTISLMLLHIPYFLPEFEFTFIYDRKSGAMDIIGGDFWYNLSMTTCIVPLLIIFPVNVGILYLLDKRFSQASNIEHLSKHEKYENIRLSIVLILASISHISFPVPSRICTIVNTRAKGFSILPEPFVITFHLCKLNFGINWIFYFFIDRNMSSHFFSIFTGKDVQDSEITKESELEEEGVIGMTTKEKSYAAQAEEDTNETAKHENDEHVKDNLVKATMPQTDAAQLNGEEIMVAEENKFSR